MSRIAVIHNKFTTKGGAESVCFNTIEALQDQHDITLFSFDRPDFQMLNEFCSTNVRAVPVRRPNRVGGLFNAAVDIMNEITNGRFGPQIQLKTAILSSTIDEQTTDFDMRISTGGEVAIGNPSIQYIHFPVFNNRELDSDIGVSGGYSVYYDRLCSYLAGLDRDVLMDATLLTNSEWTADVVDNLYNATPGVLHPPVNIEEFSPVPWNNRESGFVTVGRISPDKNVLRIIKIIQKVREHGHDVNLHIVGPEASHNKQYAAQVRQQAAASDAIHFEGQLSRDKLVSLICSNKYGIHGKPREHFGITVAELVAGGALPFVPDSGGQAELVNHNPALMYSDAEDAVDTIDKVLSNPGQAEGLRRSLPNVSETLGQQRFQDEIADIVNSCI